jgi:hypothetical protein
MEIYPDVAQTLWFFLLAAGAVLVGVISFIVNAVKGGRR